MNKLFAFWRYDLFPFILGGEISQIRDDGTVYAISYQCYFNPLRILPLEAGKKLNEKLKMLREAHRTAQLELDEKYKEEAKELTRNFGILVKELGIEQ